MTFFGKVMAFLAGEERETIYSSPVVYTGDAVDALQRAGSLFQDHVDMEATRLAEVNMSYDEAGRLLVTEEHVLQAWEGNWTLDDDLRRSLEAPQIEESDD